MKNVLSTLFLCSIFTIALAQGTTGLVAHWEMNGNANDVTGNGHNGHLHYVTPVAGADGLPNTAYYFNGSTSFISAPYMPDLNFTDFSICATVKIQGFYNGPCQGNYIIARGGEMGIGNWSLRFDDNAFNTCSMLDSTKEVFISTAGTNGPVYASDWQYTPTIVRDTWYKVVVTYKSPTWKIYVNCQLINTVTGPGYTIGSDMDSIVMGMNIWHAAAGYPYPFKGAIDDIRLYNRALHDTEITGYCDTCGYISAAPSDIVTTLGSTATFSVTTTIALPSYQWQCDTGSGYFNIVGSSIYTGVNTPALSISGVTPEMNGYHYRCHISNENACEETSDNALLAVYATRAGIVITEDMIKIYPCPATDNITLELPDFVENSTTFITNGIGRTVLSEQISSNHMTVNLSGLMPGVYTARITCNGQVVCKRIIKQ